MTEEPKLQIRKEPDPPTRQEQDVLDLLWTEFEKSDTVAKAAARFEAEVHKQLMQQRLDSGLEEDEAGDVPRVFRADDFNGMFRQLLLLRIEIKLLHMLDLDKYEEAIIQERIHTVFGGKKSNGMKKIAIPNLPAQEEHLHIGSPEARQMHALKMLASKRRR